MRGRPHPPSRYALGCPASPDLRRLAAAEVTADELALGDLDGRGALAVRPAVERAAAVAHAHALEHADLADLGIRTNHFVASFGLSSSRTTCVQVALRFVWSGLFRSPIASFE